MAELFTKGNTCENAIQHLEVVETSKHSDITDSIRQKARLYLGSCYARTNDFPKAIAILNKADKVSKLEPGDLRILTLSYMRAEDTTNALIIFDRILKESPTTMCDFMLSFARIYNVRKDYENVIRILTIAVNSCPKDNNTPYCYYLIGISNFELKNVDAAITALQKAIDIDPMYFFAHIYLGDIYINQKNIAEGEKMFDYVLENGKTDPAKYNNELNMAYQKLCGNKLEAKRYSDLQKLARQ